LATLIVIQVQWTREEFTKKKTKEKHNPVRVVNMRKLISSILCGIFAIVGGRSSNFRGFGCFLEFRSGIGGLGMRLEHIERGL
jgi:hypothetical protein